MQREIVYCNSLINSLTEKPRALNECIKLRLFGALFCWYLVIATKLPEIKRFGDGLYRCNQSTI